MWFTDRADPNPRITVLQSARRTSLYAFLTVAVTGLTAPAATAESVAEDRREAPRPDAVARQHGVDARHGAPMGWRLRDGHDAAGPAAPQTAPADPFRAEAAVPGMDVSGHTVGNDWKTWHGNGIEFAYIKASEGDYLLNTKFAEQWTGATQEGVVRGSYHFANPKVTDGATQADYFIEHGGGWTPDDRTLPGALDIEWNPYEGNDCYDRTPAELQQFVADFVGRYQERTGTRPIIYTARSWWDQCMGSSPSWRSTPLWIAHWTDSPGPLPDAWKGVEHTIWQNAAWEELGYDTDLFNGDLTALKAFATNGA